MKHLILSCMFSMAFVACTKNTKTVDTIRPTDAQEEQEYALGRPVANGQWLELSAQASKIVAAKQGKYWWRSSQLTKNEASEEIAVVDLFNPYSLKLRAKTDGGYDLVFDNGTVERTTVIPLRLNRDNVWTGDSAREHAIVTCLPIAGLVACDPEQSSTIELTLHDGWWSNGEPIGAGFLYGETTGSVSLTETLPKYLGAVTGEAQLVSIAFLNPVPLTTYVTLQFQTTQGVWRFTAGSDGQTVSGINWTFANSDPGAIAEGYRFQGAATIYTDYDVGARLILPIYDSVLKLDQSDYAHGDVSVTLRRALICPNLNKP